MRWKAAACSLLGHRWTAVPDSAEDPLFECGRCGRREEFAPGTQHAGFGTRVDAETRADSAVGPFRRGR